MPKIQTSCPNCKSPLVAEIQQVIDVGRNPQLKEVLLAGGLNVAACQVCGFQGQLPVPIVYHDPEKEILFTYSPPDMNMTMEEKEAALAPLLKNVTDSLDPKDRKGYLFQPQAMLSMASLVKNVLLEDGITEEMIQAQQEKVNLLDELFSKEGDELIAEVIENEEQIDREFFTIFAEVAQRIIASQDEKMINKIQTIQEALLSETEVGKQILTESTEMQAATKSIEALGENISRESLLELVINAPTDERVKALTSMVRPALDYEFFQKFTERIENESDENRKDLIEKRNLMLKLTQEIDQQVQERLNKASSLIETIITGDSMEEQLITNLGQVDQFFIQALSAELEQAIKENEKERRAKLETLLGMIQEITTPAELKALDHLMTITEQEDKLTAEVENLDDEITEKLNEYLISAITTYQQRLDTSPDEQKKEMEDTLEKLQTIHNVLLKQSMKKKFKGN